MNTKKDDEKGTKGPVPAFFPRVDTPVRFRNPRSFQSANSPDPGLASQTAIQRFVRDPENPFLISFPRTGSHWLRMIVELYFERPLLVRTFFYPERDDYLLLHDHDIKLRTQRRNVIYLYRDTVDTVFSTLMYHREEIDDQSRIGHWADIYGKHLKKWLYSERFTTRKTIVAYESLRQDPLSEMKKVVAHFNMPLNVSRLRWAIDSVSKKSVKEKTEHDIQVISRDPNYKQLREDFRLGFGDYIHRRVRGNDKGRANVAQDLEKSTQRDDYRKDLGNRGCFGKTAPCSSERASDFIDAGFHGDLYLLQFVDLIIDECDYFIETGTNAGSTLTYMARQYSELHCLSCEPDLEAFREAIKNTAVFPNVSVYNETSQAFIARLKNHDDITFFETDILFWLDAHGNGFEWPLKEEVYFITRAFKKAYVLIDDFKVPGLDCFGYDVYRNQVCSFDYIKDALNPAIEYQLYYPSYTDRTSSYHPLRGWGLIAFGYDHGLKLPAFLRDRVRRVL